MRYYYDSPLMREIETISTGGPAADDVSKLIEFRFKVASRRLGKKLRARKKKYELRNIQND